MVFVPRTSMYERTSRVRKREAVLKATADAMARRKNISLFFSISEPQFTMNNLTYCLVVFLQQDDTIYPF